MAVAAAESGRRIQLGTLGGLWGEILHDEVVAAALLDRLLLRAREWLDATDVSVGRG